MSNVRKVSLTIGLVVLAGFGLFTINVIFTVPTVMAMPWNGRIFDAVGRTSERGLLNEVSSRKGVRNSGRESRGGASRGSGQSRGGGATTGRGSTRGGEVSRGSGQSRGGGATTGRGSTRERAGTPGRTKPGGSGVTRGDRGKASARGRGHRADRRYSARKDARRDYRRFRAITGAIRLGVYLATRPRYSTTVVVTGTSYYYWGGVYYASSGSGYVVVASPPGAVVYAVPTATTVVYVGSTPYYYYGGTYYITTTVPAQIPPPQATSGGEASSEKTPTMTDDEHSYEVVKAPIGATVPYLPEEAEEQTIKGKKYFHDEGTYYQPFSSEGETIYMVVENPA